MECGCCKISFLSNVRKIIVSACRNLKSVFPASAARDLLLLAFVRVVNCGFEEIVSKEDGKEMISGLEFPRLIALTLRNLTKLKRFYPGTQMAEFPKLKYLRVYGCKQVNLFTLDSQHFREQCSDSEDQNKSPSRQFLFSAEKVATFSNLQFLHLFNFTHLKLICLCFSCYCFQVIPTLEELPLNYNDARILTEEQFPVNLLGNVKFLQVQNFHGPTTFPLDLIDRFNNLSKLNVSKCCFRDIFACDGFSNEENRGKNLENIWALGLYYLYNLMKIKLDHVLKNLETLEVSICFRLTNLLPPSSSFPNLKVTSVQGCDGLVTLITSSTAEGLPQLTKLMVVNCKMLTEVLSNEGNEGKTEITFPKLQSLKLDRLASITKFSSANYTLRFPSLEEVILKQCPEMEIFSQGNLHARKLQRVQTESEHKIRWRGDLNATVQQLYMVRVL